MIAWHNDAALKKATVAEMARSICERLRAPDFWTAGFHRNGSLSEQEEAAPFEAATLIETQAALLEECREAFVHLESEARRFASFYPKASDGRNTFVIFADKIATLAKLRETHNEA